MPGISCRHRDNFGHCRIHKAPWYARWALPKGRPECTEDVRRYVLVQDDSDLPPPCADRAPHAIPSDAPRPPRI